jgi:hypothetical protein
MWFFGVRVGLAASYLTVAVTDPDIAGTLAGPFAGCVLIVAVIDLIQVRKTPPPQRHRRRIDDPR